MSATSAAERFDLQNSSERAGEGIAVVDARRRVAYVDRTARVLLDGRLPLDEPVPALFLENGTVMLAGADGRPALELRPRPGTVDGGDGWLIAVADASHRSTPEDQIARMLGFAAHELRTPIAAVAGYAGTILEHGDRLGSIVVKEFLTTIERQARRLDRMTTMLLGLSKGADDVEPQDVEIGAALAEVLGLLGGAATDVRTDGDLDARVVCDPVHLQELFTNLVSNAFKYGEPPVVVRVEAQSTEVVVEVVDHGSGVPEGFVHRMWDLFSRARADERPAGVEGSGIGLGLVRSMAAANGGTVSYAPNQPTGSVFTLRLPRAR